MKWKEKFLHSSTQRMKTLRQSLIRGGSFENWKRREMKHLFCCCGGYMYMYIYRERWAIVRRQMLASLRQRFVLGHRHCVSSALLLNEVSEKNCECETKFPQFSPKVAPKFAPKFSPKYSVLSWQVEKSSPQFHQLFPIGDFKFQIEFQIKYHQKLHKHTSAGLAALTLWHYTCRGLSDSPCSWKSQFLAK